MQLHQTRRTFLGCVFSRGAFALVTVALLCVNTVRADSADDALKAVADATTALVNDDSAAFLDQFDRNMPGYATLRTEVEGLLNASNVGSTVDVITNSGDGQKRTLELDWVLVLSEKSSGTGAKETRRHVVKCQAERRGKVWKIMALEPVELFKP